ncbi:hypothetical protein [Phreatobacter stygius]|uniref:Uncharacterized protein n=1 Tax=Phreatobacter stygius TaxID=1940610 RepID=A0A4D7B9S1_9HYPH|nr:hypothetical protein [Phreatobacter stygius]QCI67513.1 hypothetical protein E8M01_26790 [Phreatobacter stygius]
MDDEIPGRRDWRTDNLARAVTGLNGVPSPSLRMGDHRQALRDYLLANDLDVANRPVAPKRTWRETLSLGWPGRMAIDLYDAFTLPGDMMTDPNLARELYDGSRNMSPETRQRVLDLSSMGFGAAFRAIRGAAPATRSTGVSAMRGTPHDPASLPQRPFHADYPNLAIRGDGSSTTGLPAAGAAFGSPLTQTIDGAAITAPIIAGRRTVGGPDQGLSLDEVRGLGEALTGRPIRAVPASELPKRARAIYTSEVMPDGTRQRSIAYNRDEPPTALPGTLGHEAGHAVEDFVGILSRGRGINQTGLDRQLRQIYHDSRSSTPGQTRRLAGPEDWGYPASEVPGELMAEAIRVYLLNPNYIKSIAPELAERIRRAVNTHPDLSKHIQFNQGAPLPPGALGAGQERGPEVPHAAPEAWCPPGRLCT